MNGNLKTNIISNEYEFMPSGVNLKIENHTKLGGVNQSYINPAALIALQQEQLRMEEEIKKKKLIDEREKKIKGNLKKYNINKKQNELFSELKKQEEKINKKERLEKLNQELKNKIIKNKNSGKNTSFLPNNSGEENLNTENYKDFIKYTSNTNSNNNDFFSHGYNRINNQNAINSVNIREENNTEHSLDSNNPKKNIFTNNQKIDFQTKINSLSSAPNIKNSKYNNSNPHIYNAKNSNLKNSVNINSKEFETFSFNDIEREMEKPPKPTEKMQLKIINRELKENESVIDIRDDIESIIKRKLEQVKNAFINPYPNSNYDNIDTSEKNHEENSIITPNNNKHFHNKLNNENKKQNSYSTFSNLNSNNNQNRGNLINNNTTFCNTSLCDDISNISSKKNQSIKNNVNLNNSKLAIKNLTHNNNNLDNKSLKYTYNSIHHQNNLNSFYLNSTNILSSNRINDSALSDFSSDNPNNKLKKNKSSGNIQNDKDKIKHNYKSFNKNSIRLNNHIGESSNSDFTVKRKRINSANNRESDSHFFKIISTRKTENIIKNNLNTKYYISSTQGNELESEPCNNINNINPKIDLNVNQNHHPYNPLTVNNNDSNTSCISDLNIKSILEKNISNVKNFRKTGMPTLPEEEDQSKIQKVSLRDKFEIKSYSKNNSNINTSCISNNNTNNFFSGRKLDNVNNTSYMNTNNNNKSFSESSIIRSNKESKSLSKINVNLQKRR